LAGVSSYAYTRQFSTDFSTGDIPMAKKEKAPARTRLSRKDMENVIKVGGSVLHDGEIITKVDELPDEIDLAETDEELAAATEAIEQEEAKVASKKTKAAGKTSGGKKTKTNK
jgi:hypothetical protein